YQKVRSGAMPMSKPRLSDQDVEIIRQWIETKGAGEAAKIDTTPVTQHDILPIMLNRCTVCHGLRRREAGLDLRTKAGMLQGGKSGPVIGPGKPEESLLVKRIQSGEMPPKKLLIVVGVKPATPVETEKIARWIAQGAPEVAAEPDVAGTAKDPLVTDKDR